MLYNPMALTSKKVGPLTRTVSKQVSFQKIAVKYRSNGIQTSSMVVHPGRSFPATESSNSGNSL
jgi:hypothetical protein